MADKAYKVIAIIGVSEASWEDATQNAVSMATESFRHPGSPRSPRWMPRWTSRAESPPIE